MHETRPFAIFTLLAFVFSFLVFVDMAAIASGAKKALRTRLKSRAKELTPEALMRESKKCCELLFNTDIYKVSCMECLISFMCSFALRLITSSLILTSLYLLPSNSYPSME